MSSALMRSVTSKSILAQCVFLEVIHGDAVIYSMKQLKPIGREDATEGGTPSLPRTVQPPAAQDAL